MDEIARHWPLASLIVALGCAAAAVPVALLGLRRARVARLLPWVVVPGLCATLLFAASVHLDRWAIPECRDAAGELLTERPECRMD